MGVGQGFLLPSTPSSSLPAASFKQRIMTKSQGSAVGLPPVPPSSLASSTALSMSDAQSNYWQGEWVCADCGYIYETKNFDFVYFEEQKIGITNDGGDAPIIAFSLIGGLAPLAFGVYAAL